MDSDEQFKTQVRDYLRQKKLERLRRKRLEEMQRTECQENKSRSLLELKKSTESIRMKSALKPVHHVENQTTSKTIRLKRSESPHGKNSIVDNNTLKPEGIFDSQQSSIKTHENKVFTRRLSANEKWQVSPLIELFAHQLQTKDCNTKDRCMPKYEYSTKQSLKSSSLSSVIQNAVNAFSKNNKFQHSLSEGRFGENFENPTSISAIIASHIIEQSLSESMMTLHDELLCEQDDHETVCPSLIDYYEVNVEADLVADKHDVSSTTIIDTQPTILSPPALSEEYSSYCHSDYSNITRD